MSILTLIIFLFLYSGRATCLFPNIPPEEKLIPYIPGLRLTYESSFGIVHTEITAKGSMLYIRNSGEKFTYHQDLFTSPEGLRLNKVYQKLTVMAFITREALSTYKTPLLRFPDTVVKGFTWNAKTVEYVDDDSLETVLKGTVAGVETVSVPAGTFNAIKIITVFSHSGGEESIVTDWIVPGTGIVQTVIKISSDGMMGVIRSLLGYSEISFRLKTKKML